jgi:hypothetical protein
MTDLLKIPESAHHICQVCNRHSSLVQWQQLPLKYLQRVVPGRCIELKDCRCGNTLGGTEIDEPRLRSVFEVGPVFTPSEKRAQLDAAWDRLDTFFAAVEPDNAFDRSVKAGWDLVLATRKR